jgi:hypothetical protein
VNVLIPDGLYHFALPGADGKTFALDPIETLKEIDRIARECEGKTNYEHLDLFVEWVKKKVDADLTPTQADWLMDTMRIDFSDTKAQRLRRLQTSQPATESTPSAWGGDNFSSSGPTSPAS